MNAKKTTSDQASKTDSSVISTKSESKKFVVGSLALGALALVGLGVYGIQQAGAFGGLKDREERAQEFAEHFNLNQEEVDSYFEECQTERQTERQAEMKQRLEERLSELVSEGKLSEEQKAAYLAKQGENQVDRQANREQWQNLSREERQTQREEHRAEMEQWAEQNGIDIDLIHEAMGPRGPRGGSEGGMRGQGQGKGGGMGMSR